MINRTTKNFLLKSFSAAHGFELLRFLQRRSVTIVVYHRFSDRNEPFKLRIDHFERQIRFFKTRYNIISLNQYIQALDGVTDLPKNSLIMTIDDGYWDNYHIAYPVLQKYNVPATIFLTTDFIDQKAWLWSNKLEYILKNSKFDQFSYNLNGKLMKFQVDSFALWHKSQLTIFNALRQLSDNDKNKILNNLAEHLKVSIPDETQGDFMPLTWKEIRTMHRAGIEFGSHSCSHAILSKIPLEDLQKEILYSKQAIENALQNSVNSFCYPNGQPDDYSNDVIQELKKSGYGCAVTTVRGLNRPRPSQRFELKRLSVPTSVEPRMLRQLVWTY